MFPVIPTTALFTQIGAIIAAMYPATGDVVSCRLFKNDIEPDANMTLATFEEADFADYGAVNVLMAPAVLSDQGQVVAQSGLLSFTSSAGDANQTVYGVYFTNPDDAVLGAQRFAEPQVMGGAFPQAVRGVWRFSQPQSSYGWIDVEN